MPRTRPAPEEVWEALFNLAIASANRSRAGLSHSLAATATLAEKSGKTAEAARIRQLAARAVPDVPSGPPVEGLSPTSPGSLERVIFPPGLRSEVSGFIDERVKADKLRQHNLKVPNKVLVQGPPGCGKTSLARGIAGELGLPFYKIETHAIVGKMLGETAARLGRVFEKISERPCVVLLDEAESLLWYRTDGGGGEGEMRRALCALLPILEDLPDHVVLIAATNAEMGQLDPAAVRRFDLCWHLPQNVTVQTIEAVVAEVAARTGLPIRLPAETMRTFAQRWWSLAEVERQVTNLAKRMVLGGGDLSDVLGDWVRGAGGTLP